MIDFTKTDDVELSAIKDLIQKNVEKSELERFYPYTNDILEKAKVYLYCYRFFSNIYSLMSDGATREMIKKELDINRDNYIKLFAYLEKVKKGFFNNRIYMRRIMSIILSEEADNLIDSFMILMERSTIISLSKLQGFVIEGKSKEEFKKIFSTKTRDDSEFIEPVEEELNESNEEEEILDAVNEEPEEISQEEDKSGIEGEVKILNP